MLNLVVYKVNIGFTGFKTPQKRSVCLRLYFHLVLTEMTRREQKNLECLLRSGSLLTHIRSSNFPGNLGEITELRTEVGPEFKSDEALI
jgi:hypothetical protein